MAEGQLRQPGSTNMDADLLFHMVRRRYDHGFHEVLAAISRTRRQARFGRCK